MVVWYGDAAQHDTRTTRHDWIARFLAKKCRTHVVRVRLADWSDCGLSARTKKEMHLSANFFKHVVQIYGIAEVVHPFFWQDSRYARYAFDIIFLPATDQ